MIFRNGSISERLWGLVTEMSEKDGKVVNGQWLVDTPVDVWDIVRDSVSSLLGVRYESLYILVPVLGILI